MKTVIIGLGNPILSDDGIGVVVSRKIRERLSDAFAPDDVDVKEIYAGGMRLMDAMTGYDRAWVIDAMVTGQYEPGTVQSIPVDDLCTTRNILCTHDTSLVTALELGRMLGVHLPTEVNVWGIEARDVESFGETLTDAVAAAVPLAVDAIMKDLNHHSDTEGL